MKDWKISKNHDIESANCWELYFKTDDGRKRYLGGSYDYPTAAALKDALADGEIRRYVEEHEQTPIQELYAHTMANKAIFDRMVAIAVKYGGTFLPESLIWSALKTEQNP